MTEYEASAAIDGKWSVPCIEYDRDCESKECGPDLPPHCGNCGYVREDHEERNSE